MKRKNYQEEAINNLKLYFEISVKANQKKTLVFQSPTGSGKTFIVAEFIKEIIENYKDDNFTFIWATIGRGDLHLQSKNAISRYIKNSRICKLVDKNLINSQTKLYANEIYFLNWEKFVARDVDNNWINALMSDSETSNFIDILDNTIVHDTRIILIVDESHIGEHNGDRIKEFRDTIIKPFFTIETSATPVLNTYDFFYKVNPDDVIAEGMIKKEIVVNEGLKNSQQESESTSQELVLRKAYEKRKELLEWYKQEGVNINPLVLIQIPSDNVNNKLGEEKLNFIREFLYTNYGISENNGKLAVWLSGESSFDKNEIKNFNSPIEFLVFKVAVAQGWDCPRAQILVRFREVHAEAFNIQTLGRIMRMPEAKHYPNEMLNKAYIYTNLQNIVTRIDTYNPNLVKDVISYRRDKCMYKNHPLPKITSYFKTREGSFNDATQDYYEYFENSFINKFGISKSETYTFMLNPNNIKRLEILGLDLSITAKDKIISEIHKKTSEVIDKNSEFGKGNFTANSSVRDIESNFLLLIDENLNGLARVRSESTIKMAIFNTFQKYLGFQPTKNGIIDCQSVVVAHKELFADIISESTHKFRLDKYADKTGKNGIHYFYDIPTSIGYLSEKYHKMDDFDKCIMDPLYMLIKGEDEFGDKVNQLEKDFLTYLENDENVVWYFVNGTGDVKTNFGIEYKNVDGEIKTFRPDFLVMFKNNAIGIFDTKPTGNERLIDTRYKNVGLQKFISSECKSEFLKSYKLFGNIVVKKGPNFYCYNSNELYEDINTKPENFTLFKQHIKAYIN